MIVRRHSILVLTIVLTFWAHPGSTKGERWSRQVLNSEWIPLANPRSLQSGGSGLPGIVTNPGNGNGNQPQLQPLALPPVLRDQYHQQLLQLQETQESIQKLLQLQQQLRAQQQLLQAQSYLPDGFSNDEERKTALHQSTIANIQTLPQLAPGALLPPPPGDQPQPPEFAAQDFLVSNPQKVSQNGQSQQNQNAGTYVANGGEGQKNDNGEEDISTEGLEKTKDYKSQQGGHYKNAKQLRDNQNGEHFVSQTTPGSLDVQNDGEEEVQLLYVPAETLAQRDQQQKTQRVRNRKQYASQQQQQQQQQLTRQQNRYQQQPTSQQAEEFQSQGLEGARPSAAQQNFAHQVLYQLQQEQARRTRLQQEEREKEVARLQEEQKELERQAKLHQELVFKEQDLRRQKELALRKELERQEEEARQKELQRIKELNQRKLLEEEAARKKEVERQEELEREKIAEIRAQDRKQKEAEARQAEIDRLAALERQKELEIQKSLEQQQEIERQQAEDEARARAQIEAERQAQAQAQLEAHRRAHQETIEKQRQAQIDAAKLEAQNQAQQQHHTETTRPKSLRLKGRQRQKSRQDNQPTTPSPNQPPLSVYMGSTNPVTNPEDLKVSDVLTILKNAKTISVLDSVGPDAPQVFVGPTNLEPPVGYAKFDLPYLSAIDNNRVERKVDKLPFFVAPLSFKPPPGYSKIPFPAPHIGSVVVNTLDNEPDSLDGPPGGILQTDEALQPNPTPFIEPNSYIESAQLPTGNPYVQHVTPEYSQEALVATTTPTYEASYSTTPSSGTRYRHRQFYNDRSPHPVSTALYEDHSSTEPGLVTRTKFRQYYREEQGHGTSNYNNVPTPSPQPVYQENNGPQDNSQQIFSPGNGGQEIIQQGALTSDQQLIRNSFHDLSQANVASALYNPEGSSQGLRSEFGTTQNRESQFVHEHEDSRVSPGPTQYTFDSELPRISPQLPGLVNSLIEEQELIEKTPSTTTTTKTTTTELPTTTYRSRGRPRGRIVPTRAPTTTTTESSPTRSSVADRSRRPYSRSRVRQGYATTTESYQETVYEPTKSTGSTTQEKTHYSGAVESQRKPAPRNQRYRGRGGDRNAVQPEARPDSGLSEVEHNPPSHEANYGNNPVRHSPQEPSAPVQNSNAPVYHEEGFLSSGNPIHGEDDKLKSNAQSLQETVAEAALSHDDAVREIQGVEYHTGLKTPNFGQSNVEQSPVNGFNYQSQNEKFENVPEATISPQQYSGNSFNGQRPQNAEQIYSFHGIQTGDSPGKPNINNFQNADLNREQIYGSQALGNIHLNTESDNLKSVGPELNTEFDHVPEEKNDFAQVPTTTTTEAPEVTTPRPTLTPAPLNGRQRARGRLNQNAQRVRVDSAIQTRPTGSRDEFVRFSAVNQGVRQHSSSGRIHPGGTRQRLRNRGQVNQANIQTEGNDFVRIQSPLQRPTTTTTTTTTTEAPVNYAKEPEEEIEYGFIRPPSFKPIHPVVADRPIAQNVAPTYRPKYEQVQTEEPSNDAPVEVNTPQSQILKNRQKYHLPNRRPLTRSTTALPPLTTTSTEVQTEDVHMVRPKAQNDEYKGSRIRGRVRKPGKRRTTTTSTTTTTTTTESVFDSSNELPLDENYPRIYQGVPPASSDAPGPRRTLFDEELKSPNLETLPEAVALQRPAQVHSLQHQADLQSPRQDFVLNFGIGSEHEEGHEEYDQTQLASSHQHEYKKINRGHSQTRPGSLAIADIEGAESQWSTKLTHSSFQPSSLQNQVHSGTKNNERQEKSEDSFDIITAGPDLASNAPRDIIVNTSYLGNGKNGGSGLKKTQEKPVLQSRSIIEGKNETFEDDSSSLDGLQFWNYGQIQENLNGQKNQTKIEANLNPDNGNDVGTTPRISQEALNGRTDIPKTDSDDVTSISDSEISEEPTTTKRTIHRRRRVRIRVRPADDFVSAESQHVSSAWNSLIHDKQNHYGKPGSFDDFKTTTMISPTSSTTEPTTAKSFFEQFLDEMTKNSELEIPVAATSTTTNVPENTEPTTNGVSIIPEENETPEVTTTPGTTLMTPKTAFTNVDAPTTTVESETTLKNEKFVTEATTERHHFSPKSHETKKTRPSEPISGHRNRFHPKHPEKIWWNHSYEAVTKSPQTKNEEEDETVTSKASIDIQEPTTITNVEEKDSASEHSLSDYVDAFFKTMEGGEEEEKIAESDGTSESSSSMSVSKVEEDKEPKMILKTVSEEGKGNVSSSLESTTVHNVEEELAEEKKITNIEDALTTEKIEDITTSSGQEITTNSAPITTPEVPFSPEELTTEIPATTTTIPTTTKTDIITNQLAKVLRTSETTEISHMTEICYRGRCVKTKSRKEIKRR